MSAKHSRILLMDIGAPFGGVETYLANLAALLQGRCKIYCICALPQLAELLRSQSVHVICIPILFHRLAKIARFFLCVPVLIYMMLRYRIDTVQFNGYLESWLIPLVRMFGRRAVRTAHGPTEIDRYRWYSSPISYFPRFGSMLCMRAASKVVCVSHAVYADTAGHVDASRLSVVSNWVQPPTRLRDRSQLNSPPAVLYVGRLERYKGLHLLIEAVRNLPHPVHLIVVGDGRDRAHLQGLASGMHCDFMGFLPNTADFYYSSDLFVNPSLGPEGLPIVSLEAMASGIPCIFSALPVHSEISAQGKGAALCKVDDVQDLTSALERLLFHTNERVTLSDNAQEIVRKRYSPTVALKGYLAALQILQLTVDL